MGNGVAARSECTRADFESFSADAQALIQSLIRENDDLRQQLHVAEERIATLQNEAREDPLTGLLNRRGLDDQLQRAVDLVHRYEEKIALLFADLNDFKQINDDHGHAIGDLALKHVSGLFRDNVRRSDVIARIGGDEFAILLWQTDQSMAEAKADALADLIATSPLCLDGIQLDFGVSIGATELSRNDEAAGSILDRADRAMYAAKEARDARLLDEAAARPG